MKLRALFTIVLLAATVPAMAGVSKAFRIEHDFSLAAGGTLVLENPVGNIEIFGGDVPNVRVDVIKTVVASDDDAIEEGRNQTALVVGGNEQLRILRASITPSRGKPWSSNVAWRVRVPRLTHLRVEANSGQFIRLFNIDGNVYIRNVNGDITLENVTGIVTADSVNGSIVFGAPALRSDVKLSTVNGNITARLQSDVDFRWIADTARGDIRTNLAVNGAFQATTFRGSVNAPARTTLTTISLMGNIYLYGAGVPVGRAKSLRDNTQQNRKGFRRAVVEGNMTYATNLGDVTVGQVRGNADVLTEAGMVQLGSVTGDAKVRSFGGAVQLGQVTGELNASTRAGDVQVEVARRGGTITTNGGTIRLAFSGGPAHLRSGGGDVVVRQAVGPVNARTKSGDIAITADSASKGQKIDALTEKGNVVLHVGAQFGADVDATIVTSDPDAHTFLSDIAGLSISRDQVDGKTRIRATGKINGGGERVTLQATDGSIRILTATAIAGR